MPFSVSPSVEITEVDQSGEHTAPTVCTGNMTPLDECENAGDIIFNTIYSHIRYAKYEGVRYNS